MPPFLRPLRAQPQICTALEALLRRYMHSKFGQHWPRTFRGERTNERTTTTDEVGSVNLTWAFVSCELKKHRKKIFEQRLKLKLERTKAGLGIRITIECQAILHILCLKFDKTKPKWLVSNRCRSLKKKILML